MNSPLLAVAIAALTVATTPPAVRADEPTEANPPTSRPTNGNDAAGLPVLRADNPAALADHVGNRVVIVGTIQRAEWSRSGKVMNVTFAGAEPGAFGVAVFEKDRAAFDDAFGGNFAKTIRDATVRLTGLVSEYGGNSERYKGRPELILRDPRQVTITKPAPPTTRPAEDDETAAQ